MAPEPSRSLLICANTKCDFLVHEDKQFGGFCCKRCHWCLERDEPPEHGEKCGRLPPPADAVRADPTPPDLPMSALRSKTRNKRPKKPAAEVADAPGAPLPSGQAVSRRPRPPDKPPPPPPSGREVASATARKSSRGDTRERYLDESDDEHRRSSQDERNRMRSRRRRRRRIRSRGSSRSRSRSSGESWEASRDHHGRRCYPRGGSRDSQDRPAQRSRSRSAATTGKAKVADRATASDRREAGGHAGRRSAEAPHKPTSAPQAAEPEAVASDPALISIGERVQIGGMSKKPKLNGMLGKVVEVHEEKGNRKFDVRILKDSSAGGENIQGILRKVGASYISKVAAERT
eukprot:TRINITY_DN3463_c0_g1_i1.p1 TRINITY_DN3463_c0_g1~~TRINITY_DN3463_c0_g1_i1.p1  ORF type:complete len:356 (+),score=57.28 TRINITY_DN3463_c0_g1_i1:28-1068(+)